LRLLLQNVKGLTFFGTHGRTSVAKQQPVSCTVCGDAVTDREDRATERSGSRGRAPVGCREQGAEAGVIIHSA